MNFIKNLKSFIMLVKVNNHSFSGPWNGLVREILNDLDQNPVSGRLKNSVPSANIYETDAAFHVELAVPGRNKSDFNMKVENSLLTLSCNKKAAEDLPERKAILCEFKSENFTRSFSINDKIDANGISAHYENGLLKVSLPKKHALKSETRQIAIQ